MAAPYTSDTLNVTSSILAFPDHYVAKAISVSATDTNVTTVGTKKLVKAGTVWPANDGTAEGIVLNDVYVTHGDNTGAIVVHGFIREKALPTAPAAAAKTALSQITFI